MKCAVCGKEINEFEYDSYEWLGGVGGDPIHKSCKPTWNKFCERVDNMSDNEFKLWLTGAID